MSPEGGRGGELGRGGVRGEVIVGVGGWVQ